MSNSDKVTPKIGSLHYIWHFETLTPINLGFHLGGGLKEFRQPLQVQSHLEMPGILVQLGHTQRT